MSLLLDQHKLLKLLSNQFVEWDKTHTGTVAVPFDTICKELNCNKEQLHIITAQLFSEKEVGLYNVSGVEGLYIDKAGLSSYAGKKYLKEKKTKYFDEIKNWVQVTIPVLSLLLAILIFIRSNDTLTKQDKELQAAKKQVELLRLNQRKFQDNVKLFIDSLSSANKVSARK